MFLGRSARSFLIHRGPPVRRRYPSSLFSDKAKLYLEWSLEDDQILFENRHEKTIPELASILGRGLKGVESRLEKLTNVQSNAYARLFAQDTAQAASDSDESKGLVPAGEVLRRIQWDYSLPSDDFSVLYYDRVEDQILEVSMTEPNTSVSGKAESFVFAIPEHRIEGIKYKERIVWDKEQRLDRVFGSMGGHGETIVQVMQDYDKWKERRDLAQEWNRQRQKEVSERIQLILGQERFDALKALSSELLACLKNEQERVSAKQEADRYIAAALTLFAEACQENSESSSSTTNYDALDLLSELVALLPNSTVRPIILNEISQAMNRGKPSMAPTELAELKEDEITETFVRGSGAGGQKINKTSNRVVLVHEPTQLKVECQDTRSLQQNRKIARKRLRLKLDDYINGNQSRSSVKARKAVNKKARAKRRSKVRQRQRNEVSSGNDSNNESP